MAHDSTTSHRLYETRPKGGAPGRAFGSDSTPPRAALPASPISAAPPVRERCWERWFWSLFEMSWSDLWRSFRQWEGRLRPDSPRMAGVWFIAWTVTGLSGILLLLSLLTGPSPRANSRIRLATPQTHARSSQPVYALEDGTSEESADSRVISALSEVDASTNDPLVQSADFVSDPISISSQPVSTGTADASDDPGALQPRASQRRQAIGSSDHSVQSAPSSWQPRGGDRHARILRMTYSLDQAPAQEISVPRTAAPRTEAPALFRQVVPRQTANGVNASGVPEVFRVRPISAPARSPFSTPSATRRLPSHDSTR